MQMHATAVCLDGRGMLILGGSGAGKSGLAAQMIALGAALVADDSVIVDRAGHALRVRRPPGGPPLIEARGIGLLTAPLLSQAMLAGAMLLAPSLARLPMPETLTLLGISLPLIRHPYTFDAAAKAALWLRAL